MTQQKWYDKPIIDSYVRPALETIGGTQGVWRHHGRASVFRPGTSSPRCSDMISVTGAH